MSALQQLLAAISGPGITVAYFTSNDSPSVPGGVTSISMLAIGGGGGGNDCQAGGGSGGAGGGLSFSNNVAVTPGETLTITVGNGGARGTWGGGGTPGTGGTGGTTSIKRGATVLVEATGGQGGYSPSSTANGGNYSGAGTGSTKYVGGAGGLPAGSEIRGGQGGGAGSLDGASNGANGVTATTDYRGGGYGGGAVLDTSLLDNIQSKPGLVNSATRNGSNNTAYKGSGGGGGTYGDAGLTLAGIGAAGAGGLALLVWNNRTFVAGDMEF